MSYHAHRIADLTVGLVQRQPWLSVAEVSERLGIHRHTLQRALKACGRSFASIKLEIVVSRLERHFASGGPESFKQIWSELGFVSAGSFARYVRHATGRSPTELRADWVSGHLVRKRAELSLDRKRPERH